jgi:hypothetical protein
VNAGSAKHSRSQMELLISLNLVHKTFSETVGATALMFLRFLHNKIAYSTTGFLSFCSMRNAGLEISSGHD